MRCAARRPDLRAAPSDEWIVPRHDEAILVTVADARHLDSQQLAEKRIEVLGVIGAIAATAAVTHRDVEKAIGPKARWPPLWFVWPGCAIHRRPVDHRKSRREPAFATKGFAERRNRDTTRSPAVFVKNT